MTEPGGSSCLGEVDVSHSECRVHLVFAHHGYNAHVILLGLQLWQHPLHQVEVPCKPYR